MGCAASTDRAERRRRGRALGHSEASTTGLLAARQQGQNHPESVAAAAGRRRGCKVAPEPKEQQEEEQPAPEPAMPGSPSFRYYCQKAAAVDALVAEADGSDSDGSVRVTASRASQAPKTNDLTEQNAAKNHKVIEVSKPKQVTRWLRFRGLAIVAAAWYNLFSRHSSKKAEAAAKSHPPCPAPALAAPTRSHP